MMLSTRNKALQISLRCLTHPLSLLMVGLLLLNDRLLKWQFASWWTGKLSDVAGLFFFPFVLTTVISLFWQRRAVGPAAIFTVGWLFALIKVIPGANELAIQLWSALLAAPVAIALDPTDLLALPALGLSAWLWRREWDRPVPIKPSPLFPYLAALAWSVALLAGLGSSCLPDERILAFAQIGGDHYAFSNYREAAARFNADTMQWESTDWLDGLEREEHPGSQQICLEQTDVCFRIANPGTIEESLDGGGSWQTAWSYPFGRMEYMRRVPLCGPADTDFYDLAIIPSGNPDSFYLIAAAGNQGAIVRDRQGNWHRQGILDAEPHPMRAPDLETASVVVLGELFMTTAIAFVSSLVLLLAGWRRETVFRRLLLTCFLLFLGIIVAVYLTINSSGSFSFPFSFTGLAYLSFWVASGLVIRQQHAKGTEQPNANQAVSTWATATISNHIFPASGFILWAVGVIPHIIFAWVLAVLMWIAIYWRSYRKIKRSLKTTAPLADFEIGPEKWR